MVIGQRVYLPWHHDNIVLFLYDLSSQYSLWKSVVLGAHFLKVMRIIEVGSAVREIYPHPCAVRYNASKRNTMRDEQKDPTFSNYANHEMKVERPYRSRQNMEARRHAEA